MDSSTLIPNQVATLISTAGAKRIPWTTEGILDLLKENQVVLFARGTRQEPRCGFTARTIDYLDSKGIDFLCLDVLADKSLIPAVTNLYGHCSFPLVVAKERLITKFENLQLAIEGDLLIANG